MLHQTVQEGGCQGELEEIGVAHRNPIVIGFRCPKCKREFLFAFVGEDEISEVYEESGPAPQGGEDAKCGA